MRQQTGPSGWIEDDCSDDLDYVDDIGNGGPLVGGGDVGQHFLNLEGVSPDWLQFIGMPKMQLYYC